MRRCSLVLVEAQHIRPMPPQRWPNSPPTGDDPLYLKRVPSPRRKAAALKLAVDVEMSIWADRDAVRGHGQTPGSVRSLNDPADCDGDVIGFLHRHLRQKMARPAIPAANELLTTLA